MPERRRQHDGAGRNASHPSLRLSQECGGRDGGSTIRRPGPRPVAPHRTAARDDGRRRRAREGA
jgi:hypothetical protein